MSLRICLQVQVRKIAIFRKLESKIGKTRDQQFAAQVVSLTCKYCSSNRLKGLHLFREERIYLEITSQ